jgi:hypothetical protein
MSDAAWGFWGSVVGGLVGGVIAYFVAIRAARVQTDAIRLIENSKHEKELAYRLLREIDDYIDCSFRGEKEDRQRAARAMLTSAALCISEQYGEIARHVDGVDRYHFKKPGAMRFPEVRDFFENLQIRLSERYFGVRLADLGEKRVEDKGE